MYRRSPHRGKRDHLVCAAAKDGAGCVEEFADLTAILEALFAHGPAIIACVPRGIETRAVEAAIAEITIEIDVAYGELASIVRLETSGHFNALLQERREDVEARLAALLKQHRDLVEEAEAQADELIDARLKRLASSIGSWGSHTTPAEINVALKSAVSRMVVEPEIARVRIYWRHGERSDLFYGQFL